MQVVGAVEGGGFGQTVTALVGHRSHFRDPATDIAKAINAALDPNAPAPRRFVRKKRDWVPHEGALLDEDGRLTTSRYRSWTPSEVAKENPGWLAWTLALDCATDADKKAIRRALIVAKAKVTT